MKPMHITLGALVLAANLAWAHGGPDHHAPRTLAPEQTDWGIAGDAKRVGRTVTLTMSDDMRFSPARIDVKQGETLRLRLRNGGKLQHELVLGTPAQLAAHAELMRKHPGMEHDEPWMAHVAPGKTGEIVWTFNRAGEFEFACLIDGHYQAGMKGSIRVVPSPGATAAAPAPAMQHGMHHALHGGMHGAAASPYAGQQSREIKALSEQELTAYRQGQGFGFAKAAELNGYPGPMHVLELADALGLSEPQRQQSQALLERHKAEARRLGAELIEAERALDQAFASRAIDADSLPRLTRAAGDKQAELRAEHLRTHLAQTALLTAGQVARYKELRGYAEAAPMPAPQLHRPMQSQEMRHDHTAH